MKHYEDTPEAHAARAKIENDILRRYREGDPVAANELGRRILSCARIVARDFNLSERDYDDYVQSSCIRILGILNRPDWHVDSTKGSLLSFMRLAVTRHMLTMMKNEVRGCHSILRRAGQIVEDIDGKDGVSDEFELEEWRRKFIEEELSEMERRVAEYLPTEMTMQEISDSVGLSLKAIDNVIQRIRRKYIEVERTGFGHNRRRQH